jgi:hypothetical protein
MRPALILRYSVALLMRRIFAASRISKRSCGRDWIGFGMDAAFVSWIQTETRGFTATLVIQIVWLLQMQLEKVLNHYAGLRTVSLRMDPRLHHGWPSNHFAQIFGRRWRRSAWLVALPSSASPALRSHGVFRGTGELRTVTIARTHPMSRALWRRPAK